MYYYGDNLKLQMGGHIQLRSFLQNTGQYSFHDACSVKTLHIFVEIKIFHKHPKENCILSNERRLSACTLAHCRNGKAAIMPASIHTIAETVYTKAWRHNTSTFLYTPVGSFINLI
jgi:hypothetical protein